MRRLAALLLPVLALTACAPGGYGPYPGGGRYSSSRDSDRWYDDRSVPLEARIVPDGSWFGVEMNRPAYVALFEILPGRGVAMVYPTNGQRDEFYPAGYSAFRIPSTRRYDWYDTGYNGRYLDDEPRYVFLVASRRPLRVSRFIESQGSLRTVLGYSSYTAMNYRTVMNDLVDIIVPPQSDDDWTTDVYSYWPNSQYRDRYAYTDQYYTRVYCGDGSYQWVPWELYGYACPGTAHRHGHPSGSTGNGNGGNPPPPRDTTQVTSPGRRRPEPPGSAPGGAATDGTTRTVPERRTEPQHQFPGMRDDDHPRVSPESGNGAGQPQAEPRREEPRREEPRRAEPRQEPRREEPRREEPRVQQPRAEPRSEPREVTRQETPRSEPRSEPRHEAPRSEAPRSESPRSEAPRSYSPPPSPPPPPPPPPQQTRSEPRSEVQTSRVQP